MGVSGITLFDPEADPDSGVNTVNITTADIDDAGIPDRMRAAINASPITPAPITVT